MDDAVNSEDYPVVLLQDRYNGAYARGDWIAIAEADVGPPGERRIDQVLAGGHGEDIEAQAFWADPPEWVAVGWSPNEALRALKARHAPTAGGSDAG